MCVRFEVFTAVTMKNAVVWDVTSCGTLRLLFTNTPWLLARKRTIPTERPPRVGEI
jgi:hypothetical protein